MNTWFFRDSLLLHNATTLPKPGAKRPATTATYATGWELHQKLKTIESSLPRAAWQQSHLNTCEYGWGWKWMMKMRRIRRDPCKESEDAAVSSSSFLFVPLVQSKSCSEYCSNTVPQLSKRRRSPGCLAEGLHIFITWELKMWACKMVASFKRRLIPTKLLWSLFGKRHIVKFPSTPYKWNCHSSLLHDSPTFEDATAPHFPHATELF